jgi:tryptophan synthase alpha chain
MTLAEAFAEARAADRALLLPYLMAGLPDAEESVSLFEAMADAGADGFEVGIPYADPLMDGPVIQEAGARALGGGMTLSKGVEVAGRVAARTEKPCLVMTYVNPILRRGVARFCADLAGAGVEGMIVADLPVDEAGPWRAEARRHRVSVVPLVAPTTTDRRIGAVAAGEPPFVYAVADLGVTGERERLSERAAALVQRVRALTDLPVGLGVGIATPAHAAAAAAVADAVIVGTALVRRVLEAAHPEEARRSLVEAVGRLAEAVRRSP